MSSLSQSGVVECPSCRRQNAATANFCGGCGSRLPGSQLKCGACGAVVSGASQFCPSCGKGLVEGEAPQMTNNRWSRGRDDFATKVEVDDVEHFRKGLIVEAGTRALFFLNGAYSGLVEAGKHEMSGIVERIKSLFSFRTTTALLLDAGDTEIAFTVQDLITSDPLSLAADCCVVLRLEDATSFFENMMKGRHRYPLSEMKAFLESEVRDATREFVGSHSVHDLSSNLSVKQSLNERLAQHLGTTLTRKGLAVIHVRVLDFRHERMNEITNQLEQYWLSAEELRAKHAGGEMAAGIQRKLLDQETARMLAAVEVHEERAKVFERLQYGDWRSEEELDRLHDEIDQRRFVRKDELAELKRTYRERGQDHEAARDLLRINQQAEQARAALAISQAQRGLTDAKRDEQRAELEHRLGERRQQELAALADKWAEKSQGLDLLDREAEIGLKQLRNVKAIKAEEADRDLDRRLREQQATAATFASLTPDALIAMAPSDRKEIIAELARTRELRHLSEEQILALAAKDSDAVAQAIQAKYSASQANANQLLEQQAKHAQAIQEAMDKNAGRMQEMFNRALDTQRDTAVAAARSGQPSMTVVTPGMSAGVVPIGVPMGAGAAPPADSARMTVCPQCRQETVAGNRYCDKCGHQFY